VQASRQADNSWLLKAEPRAGSSATYEWKRESDSVVVGTGKTLAIGVVSQTTTYRFTVTESCGSTVMTATATTSITVPLQMSTTGLVAAASGDRTKIVVSWPAVSGATQYTVKRRGSDGSSALFQRTVTTLDDTTANSTAVYAYEVMVTGGGTSNLSNVDLATRGTFIGAVANAAISPTPFDEMLRAINAVRAIAKWPSVTWQSVLAPSDPLVASGKGVAARQLLAGRARMNEALQAIGAPAPAYTDGDTSNLAVKALHVNEVQQRVQ
jgi:hypothetical protein